MSAEVFQWAVTGAGPAGIAAVGKLIDQGIPASEILWIDPAFKVGDLGQYWSEVSSNTRVSLFVDFLKNAQSFKFDEAAEEFELLRLPPEETCKLEYIVKPLQWVSDHLRQSTTSRQESVQQINLSGRQWTLTTEKNEYKAANVILATGALPSSLNYPGVDVLPFEIAIDKHKLAQTIRKDYCYGVFGSSHSAIIILRHLVELGVEKIINFYRSPCRYAINMGDWILFDNTGLKGQTATWARENIDGTLPASLSRYIINEHNLARYLPQCQQVIYAVGFETRKNLIIGDYDQVQYNPHLGIIGPGLFGLGIAYPELKADPYGSVEAQVGLWKFMVYLNKILPLWLKYHT
ncbi:Pyridine nucleotide-disulfide oxidoreductase [Legionella quinlivanii]|uniref:Pyridine nucleotide-disulfide oxidoreductase n=1 Tax=Legionella quinlivanii TaxID=45073 RepID=A0A0W0Y2X5_9GAMM|nr:NAD(P)-binding domain-containing protein [Legionella quinlivanii]KTD51415.1 Pyridine nucleotide-disulfide oxidoreductase [Legionella quinlivanii]SEG11410.1 Predicted flavoprotein CzcO associated with the cation diffusion facilitator CzcD [Legionella quinlivanii DSM 21216]STY10175.1 pyridine nucleotide-disulphide oxidoreductase [Legionella quinlivanii]